MKASSLVLVAIIVWLSVALVKVENQRYAMQVGMCKETIGWDYSCLAKVETRTNWYWHLYYALID
jgi:hypothetical protein